MCLCLGLLFPATLQGAGGPLVFQSSLATLQTLFPEGGEGTSCDGDAAGLG